MKLVDTSAWVQQIRRRGDPGVRDRVNTLLSNGEAAWCDLVRLELWNGVGSEKDRRILQDYEASLPKLPITPAVWEEARKLADRCRKAGKAVPATDVLIAACALHHGLEIEHRDEHFELLMEMRNE